MPLVAFHRIDERHSWGNRPDAFSFTSRRIDGLRMAGRFLFDDTIVRLDQSPRSRCTKMNGNQPKSNGFTLSPLANHRLAVRVDAFVGGYLCKLARILVLVGVAELVRDLLEKRRIWNTNRH